MGLGTHRICYCPLQDLLVSASLTFQFSLFSDFRDRKEGRGDLRVHQHEEVAYITPVRNRLAHLLFADAVIVRKCVVQELA
jgi:hypothetical protein